LVRRFPIAALAAVLALACVAVSADAKQLVFRRAVGDGWVGFGYEFLDAEGRKRALSFRLADTWIARGHREYRPIDSPEVAAMLRARLSKSLGEFAAPLGGTTKIDVKRSKGAISVLYEVQLPPNRATAANEAEIVRRAESTISGTYRDFFNVRDKKGEQVRPDFERIAPRYARMVKPIAEAIQRQATDERERLALALAFVQSVPYAELAGRSQGGFALPTAFFDLNRGDCDVKTAALSAILMTLLPERAQVIVLPPEHALLGIAIEPAEGDATMMADGVQYVLLEPTGPALWPVGKLARETAQKLEGIVAETIPIGPLATDPAPKAESDHRVNGN